MSDHLRPHQASVFRLDTHFLRVTGHENHHLLGEFSARLEPVDAPHEQVEIELSVGDDGIQCLWYQGAKKPLLLAVDIGKFIKQQKSFPAPKQGSLNQALGRKTKSIIDATGGWGGDALLFWSQGYEVIVLERNPLMALLLRDAMHRLASSELALMAAVEVPKVIEIDASAYFSGNDGVQFKSADCVFLDPMFPAKPKASAAVNKRIKFLHYLVGADTDAEKVAQAIVNNAAKRVVVKRPHYALPLMRDPDERFASKLVHYDVYLQNNRGL